MGALPKPTRKNFERFTGLLAETRRRLEIRACEQGTAEAGPLLSFVKLHWHILEPVTPFVDGWALQTMCAHLEAVARGEITRLLENVPPGSMKSLLLNVFFPAWMWGPMRMAHTRILSFSYASHLTERDNAKFRDLICHHDYQRRFGDRFKVTKAGEVKVGNDKTGWKIASSVGGVSTGERADFVFCFPHAEKVMTEHGPVAIGDLVDGRIAANVWSFNRNSGQLELKPIVGWHKNPGRPLVTVRLSDGSSVTCTEDHRILTPDGYVEASNLVVGDNLLTAPRWMFCSPSTVVRPHFQIKVSPNAPGSYSADRCGADAKLGCKNGGAILMASGNRTNHLLGKVTHAVTKVAVNFAVRNVLSARSIFKVVQSRVRSVAIFVSDLFVWRARTKECVGHHLVREAVIGFPFASHRDARVSFVDDGSKQASGNGERVACANYGARQASDAAKIGDLVKRKTSDFAPDFLRVIAVDRVHEVPLSTYCLTVDGNHNMLCGDVANIICSNCDDPHNVKQGESDVIRKGTVEWFGRSMSNRLNNMEKSAIVVVMQRVHEEDVSGHILAHDLGYEHLMIAAEFDGRRVPTCLGWTDPRTEDGEIFWPGRFSPLVLSRQKVELGPYGWSGQYQQAPTPAGGGILKRDWWQVWDDDAALTHGVEPGKYPKFSFIVASLDSAYTEKETNDPSALTVWGVWQDRHGVLRLMLVSGWADHLDFPKLVDKVTVTCKTYRVSKILIEAKASGISVAQELRSRWITLARELGVNPKTQDRGDFGVQLVNPTGKGDKVARAHAVVPLFAAGLVYAPDKVWADKVIDQCAQFPKAPHDDYVDTVTQALSHLRTIGLAVLPDERQVSFDEAAQHKARLLPLYEV